MLYILKNNQAILSLSHWKGIRFKSFGVIAKELKQIILNLVIEHSIKAEVKQLKGG
jgi:hypothetical protein